MVEFAHIKVGQAFDLPCEVWYNSGLDEEMMMGDRLYSDPDFYVSVQKTKILIVLLIALYQITLGSWHGS